MNLYANELSAVVY